MLPPWSAEGSAPRFHFNIHDGIDQVDVVGTELPTWQEARLEAIRLSGEIIKNEAQRMALGQDWRMEVTDETGLLLFRLDFCVMESPAVRSAFERHNKARGG